ncbi:hypothetical protein ACGF28_27360 [Bacillus mobilis]
MAEFLGGGLTVLVNIGMKKHANGNDLHAFFVEKLSAEKAGTSNE